MGDILTNVMIVLFFLVGLFILYQVVKQKHEDRERIAIINQKLQGFLNPKISTHEVVTGCNELGIGPRYCFKPWLDPKLLGQVYGRLLFIEEVDPTSSLATQQMNSLINHIKPQDSDFQNQFIAGINKVNPGYGIILRREIDEEIGK